MYVYIPATSSANSTWEIPFMANICIRTSENTCFFKLTRTYLGHRFIALMGNTHKNSDGLSAYKTKRA